MKNVPKLRFKEFSGEWQAKELGRIAAISSGGTPSRNKPEYWGGTIPWVTTSLVDFNTIRNSEEFITEAGLKNSSAKMFPENTLLMAMYGQGKTRGKVAILGFKASTNQACAAIMLDNSVADSLFVFHNLFGRYDEIRDLSNAGGQENLSAGLIKSIKIGLPTLPEQTKVANFLTAIDDRITQLTQKVDGLQQYKKAVMQQIFSQKLRFKDEDGRAFPAWNVKRLNELLIESKEKNRTLFYGKENVLSVSGLYGIVNQIKLKGRSFAGESVVNYGVVNNGDIVYTKSPLRSNPYGVIKVNKGEAGIVSTLYAIYLCRDMLNGCYLDYYFQIDDHVNGYLRPLVRKGAKNDMKVNNNHVLSGSINVPTVKEQEKIAEFLGAVDEKISQAEAKLNAVKQYKQGLLQQMFV